MRYRPLAVVTVVASTVVASSSPAHAAPLGLCVERALVRLAPVERRHIADAGDYVALLGTRRAPLATAPLGARVPVYVAVPTERLETLAPDALVELLDVRGHVVAGGPVTWVAPTVDEATGTVRLGTVVDDSLGLLAGKWPLRARVVFHFGKAVTVPAAAVWRAGGRSFVWVAEGRGDELVARRRAVRLGALVGDAYIVHSGIARGERVVVDGGRLLADGAPIIVAH
jgi:hypothetical protein